MSLKDNYLFIKYNLEELKALLIEKLENSNIPSNTLDNLLFDELIEQINEINTYNIKSNNHIKPLQKPNISTNDISLFNITLFKRIVYYIKLLKYYLVLKGVPEQIVSNTNSLKELIELIDSIDVLQDSYLTLSNSINRTQYYNNLFDIPYTLKDENNNDITEGTISVIDENDITYITIPAGDDLKITPFIISAKNNDIYEEQTLRVQYNGTGKYAASYDTFSIVVEPSEINVNIDFINVSENSKYFNSHNIGYQTDIFEINVHISNQANLPLYNIPFTLNIPNLLSISGVTNQLGNYSINQSIEQAGSHLITCTTNYIGDEINNTSATYNINIKYDIIQEAHTTQIEYFNNQNEEYICNIHLVDENTGEPINDPTYIQVFLNNEMHGDFMYGESTSYTFQNLSISDNIITWVIDDQQYITDTKLNIISNFSKIETEYFLNDKPVIKYTPSGVPTTTDIDITLEYKETENAPYNIFYSGTELCENGNIDIVNRYNDIGFYKISLSTDIEEVTLFYCLKKPFDITRTSYNQSTHVTYEATIYSDKEYDITLINNNQDISNYMHISSNYREIPSNNTYQRHLIIYINANDITSGYNDMLFTVNDYTENISFYFRQPQFELLTKETTIGENTIQIETINNNFHINNIISDYIIINNIEQTNNLYEITAIFQQTGEVEFGIVDEDDNIELHTIKVNKGNIEDIIDISLYMDQEKINSDNVNIYTNQNINVQLNPKQNIDTYILEKINFNYIVKNKNNIIHYQQVNLMYNNIFRVPFLNAGQYQIELIFNENEYYYNYIKTFNIKYANQSQLYITNKAIAHKENNQYSYDINNDLTIEQGSYTDSYININLNDISLLLFSIENNNTQIVAQISDLNRQKPTKTIVSFYEDDNI